MPGVYPFALSPDCFYEKIIFGSIVPKLPRDSLA